MVKEALSAPVKPEAAAASVYPIPGWSMLRSEKVATPFTAGAGVVAWGGAVPSRVAAWPVAVGTTPLKLGAGVPRAAPPAACTRGRVVATGEGDGVVAC